MKDLSFFEFEKSWPDRQAASDHPLRWDVHSEAFTYSVRQTATIVTIRYDKDFVNVIRLLCAELSGEPDDNLITFYLRPRLMLQAWQAVPHDDGAAEILVHDANGPLLPVIPFKDVLRHDLEGAQPNKLDIMGVQALSLNSLLKEAYDRPCQKYPRIVIPEVCLEYADDGSTVQVEVNDDYDFHEAVRLLQAQRAQRQDEDAPIIFRVNPKSSRPHRTRKSYDQRLQAPKRLFPTPPAPEIPVPEDSTSESSQSAQTKTSPLHSLPKQSRIGEINPPLSSRLNNHAAVGVSEDVRRCWRFHH